MLEHGSSPSSDSAGGLALDKARQLLAQYFPATRLIEAPSLSKTTGKSVSLKLESDLPTGSFKVRGALYSLSINLARHPIGRVVASSTGNHGAAVAYAARLLGVPARIFLPERCNPVKRERIAREGAQIVERGRDIAEACEHAWRECRERNDTFFLNDATDPDLPAATGLIGRELLEQNPRVEAVYVPVGDSALIRGVAAALKAVAPAVKIIGVQAEQAPAYFRSWRSGNAESTDTCVTIADGLATRTTVPASVAAIRQLVDDFVLVSEREMLAAIEMLLLEEHVLAEPAGAAATAALLKSAADRPGKNVTLLVSGANIAPDVLRQALSGSAGASRG